MNRDSGLGIDEQAASWFARQRSGRFGADDEQALQAWLSAAPAHAEAWADLQAVWSDLDALPRPVVGNPARPRRRARWPRALAAALVLCAGLLLSRNEPPIPDDLTAQSPVAERRQVALADGSWVILNQDSRIHVQMLADGRHVSLERGEAFFVVARDPDRPFVVDAGNGRVSVLGTRFAVRRGAERLGVAVESGRVALQVPSVGDAPVLLGAGDGVDVDYASGALRRVRLAPEEVASWRGGQLVFRDRPLAQLADELSHYRRAPVQLGDPALGALRVSGTLDVLDPDAFLAALGQLLPVRVDYRGDGRALIVRR